MAEHRRAKISDREDEYRARRRQMIISPERYDPFADGQYHTVTLVLCEGYCMGKLGNILQIQGVTKWFKKSVL